MSFFFKPKQHSDPPIDHCSESQTIDAEEEAPNEIPVTCIKPTTVSSHLKNPTIVVICKALGLTDGEYDIVREALTTVIQNSYVLRTIELDINKSSQEERDTFCNAISTALTSAIPKNSLLFKKLTVLHKEVAPWLIYKLALFRRKKMKSNTKHDGTEATNDDASIINTSFGSVDGTAPPTSIESESVGIPNEGCVVEANPKEGKKRPASPERDVVDQAYNTKSGTNGNTVHGKKKLGRVSKAFAAENVDDANAVKGTTGKSKIRGEDAFASERGLDKGKADNRSLVVRSERVPKNLKKKKGKKATMAVIESAGKENRLGKAVWVAMVVFGVSTIALTVLYVQTH
ncbi:hypothetical protein TWF694_000238 [Orbilia ellipsospora]|uniref:Uncharacterized protein n=1 Tax=Orbilia ellipsospora TaxID=2528407 RepID=A0AAV9XPK7_9PEZI